MTAGDRLFDAQGAVLDALDVYMDALGHDTDTDEPWNQLADAYFALCNARDACYDETTVWLNTPPRDPVEAAAQEACRKERAELNACDPELH